MTDTTAVPRQNWTCISRQPSSTTEATLVIKDFKREMKIRKPGEKLESQSFQLKGQSFCVSVFPSGRDSESKDHVSVFLYNLEDRDVMVDYEFCVGGESWGRAPQYPISRNNSCRYNIKSEKCLTDIICNFFRTVLSISIRFLRETC